VFKKEESVFKDWKEDTEETFQAVMDSDCKFWKVERIIKDPKELQSTKEMVARYLPTLKKIYIALISQSTYPNISWLEFSHFCHQCNLIDKQFNISALDRVFIATNVEIEQLDDNPDRALCRYELYEILIRIAGVKFKDTRMCATYPEALEKLMEEYILKFAYNPSWQEFRDEELWTLEVNDLLEANLEGI